MIKTSKSATPPTPGPWRVITRATPRGARMQVQRQNGKVIEVRKSASGKDSVFRTWREASRVARSLNEQAAIDAELRAEYAGLPPLPNLSLSKTLSRALGLSA